MKTNKTLAFLLACAMTVGVMAFGACDGADTEHSSDDGTLNSSVSDSSTSDSSVDDDSSSSLGDSAQSASESSSQSGSMSETAKAALEAAFEKSSLSDNYTETETYSNMSSTTINEESEWQMSEGTSITKYDGNKEERKDTYREKEDPLEAWEIGGDWYFHHFTSENEEGKSGDSYHQDEDGNWYKGGVSSTTGNADNNSMQEMLEGVYKQITYDENTGLYTITEYTIEGEDAMGILLGGPGFDSAETVNGTATITFHKVEIELKDGYIYRAYVEMEMHVDITAEYEGGSMICKMDGSMKEEVIYTNYGTTVVTLPEVTE